MGPRAESVLNLYYNYTVCIILAYNIGLDHDNASL